MIWFALCCAFYATLAAPRRVDAFVVSSRYQNKHGRTTSSEVTQTSGSDAVVDVDIDIDSVVQCLDEWYPPQELDQRIALSRKDGYWPFITAGEDPPQQFVYGEFDVPLLQESLKRARDLLETKEQGDDEIVFCDLGSGTGRLVMATAALYPNWKLCRGIELLESIHEEAVGIVESCQQRRAVEPLVEAEVGEDQLIPNSEDEDEDETDVLDSGSDTTAVSKSSSSSTTTGTESESELKFEMASSNGSLPLPLPIVMPLAPIELECGSFTDPYSSFCDADIIFCFSSCLSTNLLIDLARSIGRQCRPGTIVMTTEYQLPAGGVLDSLPDDPDYPSGEYAIELVDTLSGDCTVVGGTSTVFLQRVVKSLGTGTRRVKPALPVSEIAYRAIQHMEDTDSTAFLRQVSNQMIFLGFPESWRPRI